MPNRCLLYYITDRTQFPGSENERRRTLLAKIKAAAAAGVDYIQLRERDLSARDLESLAKDALTAIREAARMRTENPEPRTALLLNSRTDVALAAGADGVHLRADDVEPNEIRKLSTNHPPRTTNHFFVAKSCHTKEDVIHAASSHADFAVFAPVFEKNNPPGAHPTGLEALRDACRVTIPVLALGGVTLDNAKQCLQAGAAGIAAIRLFQGNKIEQVVAQLLT